MESNMNFIYVPTFLFGRFKRFVLKQLINLTVYQAKERVHTRDTCYTTYVRHG